MHTRGCAHTTGAYGGIGLGTSNTSLRQETSLAKSLPMVSRCIAFSTCNVGITGVMSLLVFYMGSGELNSDPHVYMQISYPQSPPPSPSHAFENQLITHDLRSVQRDFERDFLLNVFVSSSCSAGLKLYLISFINISQFPTCKLFIHLDHIAKFMTKSHF